MFFCFSFKTGGYLSTFALLFVIRLISVCKWVFPSLLPVFQDACRCEKMCLYYLLVGAQECVCVCVPYYLVMCCSTVFEVLCEFMSFDWWVNKPVTTGGATEWLNPTEFTVVDIYGPCLCVSVSNTEDIIPPSVIPLSTGPPTCTTANAHVLTNTHTLHN